LNGSNAGKAEVEDMDAVSGIQSAGYLHWNGEYYGRLDCSEIRSILSGFSKAERTRSQQ